MTGPRAQCLERTRSFCSDYNLRMPILLAPMAGASPPSLSIAVANAGGLGACGALLMAPAAIKAWASEVRATSNGGFQLNLWIPDPKPRRDEAAESAVRSFLAKWGPEVHASAGDATPPDFDAQCEAMLEVGPAIISSIMGLDPPAFVTRLKAGGADVIVAQGMEAGGHRGAFDASQAEVRMVGLFALLPAVVDAVKVPVIASGGIGDARGVAAALMLGASAAQIGTCFLRSPEARLPKAWADGIGEALPEDTIVTRAFSGRAGRSLATTYARAAAAADAPRPAPYPVQRGLTQAMCDAAAKANDLERMQAWSGQAAGLARSASAADIAREIWDDALEALA
jgi:nitronate monooxygenase